MVDHAFNATYPQSAGILSVADFAPGPLSSPPPAGFWAGLAAFVTTLLGVVTWLRSSHDRARRAETARIDARIDERIGGLLDESLKPVITGQQQIVDEVRADRQLQQDRHEQNIRVISTLEANVATLMERRARPRE